MSSEKVVSGQWFVVSSEVVSVQWHLRCGLPLALAEDLLDVLDNHGCEERGVRLLPAGVAIFWKGSAECKVQSAE